ncbi:MAG: BlaI/MecI/CopY family transcriptional regulator [Chloroflexi bacterium]|nr:MAG: BlaI/MecI/CopY family transcriptional regulator [Chloroflexota bacterium]
MFCGTLIAFMALRAGSEHMQLQNFRLNEQGLMRFLGKLEASVMLAIWDLSTATVQDVVDHIGTGANYKTIMTVMNRLESKNFLQRSKQSRAYVYKPSVTRKELDESLSRQVIDGLLGDFGPKVLVQFIDVVSEADQANLHELLDIIENKLAADEESTQ